MIYFFAGLALIAVCAISAIADTLSKARTDWARAALAAEEAARVERARYAAEQEILGEADHAR